MIHYMQEIGMSNGMITSLFITIALIVLALVAGRNLQLVPSGLQNVVEMAIEKLFNFFEDLMGSKLARMYFPLVGTLFIYILICNYSGLLPGSGEIPGLQAPTSSINCTAAMAVTVFIMTQVAGIREARGPKYYTHLLKPMAFLAPLMAIEMLVRPVSLTLRLYGNIFGEETVTHTFFEMVPIGLPVVMQALSVLMGLIQALVFSLLTAIYITEACETEEELPVQK